MSETAVDFSFVAATDVLAGDHDVLVVLGHTEQLSSPAFVDALPASLHESWPTLVEHVSKGDGGGSTTTWVDGRRIVLGGLPTEASRHNHPLRPDAIEGHLKGVSGERIGVLVATETSTWAVAAATAVGRMFPSYDRRRRPPEDEGDDEKRVDAAVWAADEGLTEDDVARVAAIVRGARSAAHLVDMAPNELVTSAFVERARDVARAVGAEIEIIERDALAERGFGGLTNVGKAAADGPAMVILSHDHPDADTTVCWVGKGIVYDTGGLSLKGKSHMPGMKCDMGGAAAVLGAFQVAAELALPMRLRAILCIAENAIGGTAYRPDDIIELYSRRTVEINNTDAEGRLVLGDGVAYATRELEPDVVVDLATLTGAQLVATGHRHAAVVCNDDALEARAVESGRRSGDLVHPLPYCPEFYRDEFKSKVADLKNSVKDRLNAQSSCAGQFVAEHLVDYDGPWLHIDLAGPAWREERGTGFGVALLIDIFSEGRR